MAHGENITTAVDGFCIYLMQVSVTMDYIELKGVRVNNLKNISINIPRNKFIVIAGVSGSGKSSLVKGILYPAIKRHLDEVAEIPGEYVALEGDWRQIRHVEMVDQNPIGKSSRSNPATYVKAYDAIRQLYADQPLAKQLTLLIQCRRRPLRRV